MLSRQQLAIARDVTGLPILHKAIIHEHTDIIRYMLRRFPDSLDLTDHVSGEKWWKRLQKVENIELYVL